MRTSSRPGTGWPDCLKARGSTQAAGNGVYADGGLFPSSSYQDENYYVDAIFTGSNSTPPSVSAFSPRNLQKGVATSSAVTATFSIPITSGSAQVAVKTSGGATVAGSTAYNATTQTATFTPASALAVSTTYTVTVSGADQHHWNHDDGHLLDVHYGHRGDLSLLAVRDDRDPGGGRLRGRQFGRGGYQVHPVDQRVDHRCPVLQGDGQHRDPHRGALVLRPEPRWAPAPSPVKAAIRLADPDLRHPGVVAAGSTSYTASYFAPNGHYAADWLPFSTSYSSGALTAPATTNGVYAYGLGGTAPTSTFSATNYWVDPLFVPGSIPPSVTSTTPASGATGVGIGTTATANFSVPVQSSTIQLTLSGLGDAFGARSLTMSAQSVTFTLSSALVTSIACYTATVSGGPESVRGGDVRPVQLDLHHGGPGPPFGLAVHLDVHAQHLGSIRVAPAASSWGPVHPGGRRLSSTGEVLQVRG